WSGKPDGESDDFLISADKNPNRNGIRLVFGNEVLAHDTHELLKTLEDQNIRLLVMMGDDLPFDAAARKRFAAALSNIEHFLLISPHGTALAKHAWAVLPAATHAEDSGTFINEDGFLQAYDKAFDPVE